MTIETGIGLKFMEELPLGIHTLSEGSPSSDVIKVALYGPNAILAPSIDTYVTAGEVAGGGYTAGGIVLTNGVTIVGAAGSSRSAGPQFSFPYINPVDDAAFTVTGVAVRGCLMYNATQGNRTIFTLDFGDTINPSVGLTIQWALSRVVLSSDPLIPLIGNQI